MAPKRFYLCLCILLFLSHESFKTQAKSHNATAPKPSPFQFINRLQGYRKGDSVSGLRNFKTYLERFGYLIKNENHVHDDNFDDLLESAIKKYQLFYHIKPTGILDSETVNIMSQPRCGVPDIVHADINKHHNDSQHNGFDPISRYVFFPNNPKWPSSKTHLTWTLPPNPAVAQQVASAFNKWADVSRFTFSQVPDGAAADLRLSFQYRNHHDGLPFTGPGGTVAHAFPPPDGRLHFDAEEAWSVQPTGHEVDVETVALHEIGHLLGLDHTPVKEAIMFAYIPQGATKGLNKDDVDGIEALYR